jgi:ABC-type phosphate transport system ATPase subunit
MLHKGRLVETGPAALMLKDPENPLTKAFIDGELLS